MRVAADEPGLNMDSDLSLEFLRVVEQAAIACAHTMGLGDWRKSDQAAVETMRKCMDTVQIDGTLEARADRSRRVSAHRTDGVRRLISRS